MADIQFAAAEIRRGKKKEEEEEITCRPILIGKHTWTVNSAVV